MLQHKLHLASNAAAVQVGQQVRAAAARSSELRLVPLQVPAELARGCARCGGMLADGCQGCTAVSSKACGACAPPAVVGAYARAQFMCLRPCWRCPGGHRAPGKWRTIVSLLCREGPLRLWDSQRLHSGRRRMGAAGRDIYGSRASARARRLRRRSSRVGIALRGSGGQSPPRLAGRGRCGCVLHNDCIAAGGAGAPPVVIFTAAVPAHGLAASVGGFKPERCSATRRVFQARGMLGRP